MAIYDVLVIFCLLFFGIVGWFRGLSWQLMGVLTIVLGFTVAYPLSGMLEPWVADLLGIGLTPSETAHVTAADQRDISYLARGAAWTGAFALIWLFTHLLYYLFREAIERWHMEEMNRSLGGIFGLLKGVLVVCAMTLVVVTLGVERTRTADPTKVQVRVPPFLDHSVIAPTVTKVLRLARFAMPGEFADGFTEYLDALPNLDEETRTATVEDPHDSAGAEPAPGKKGDKPSGDAKDDAKEDAAAKDESSGDGDESSGDDDDADKEDDDDDE